MSFRRDIKHVVIAGSGIMGASLAQMFAQHGYTVALYDIAEPQLEAAKKLISINQEVFVKEGTLTQEQSDKVVENISFSMDMDCFKDADFVIEAIVEKMPIKHDFWGKVSQLVADDVVLTSNTSGLSITEISKAVKNPERFTGMHYVNPPHIIPLVEVIYGDKSSDEAIEIVRDVALSMRRKPVTVKKDAAGFVLNRLQYAVFREALHIVDNDIASIEDVDSVMKYGLGFRYAAIGPFETVDLGGLDLFYNIANYLFEDLSTETKAFGPLVDRFEKGQYGTKTGAGFYDYSNGKDKEAIARRDKAFIDLSKVAFKDL